MQARSSERAGCSTLIPDVQGSFRAIGEARVIEFGGSPVGARYRWWNYVASRVELIDEAKRLWLSDDRPLPPGETEFTPLPADDERELTLLAPGASAGTEIPAEAAPEAAAVA